MIPDPEHPHQQVNGGVCGLCLTPWPCDEYTDMANKALKKWNALKKRASDKEKR